MKAVRRQEDRRHCRDLVRTEKAGHPATLGVTHVSAFAGRGATYRDQALRKQRGGSECVQTINWGRLSETSVAQQGEIPVALGTTNLKFRREADRCGSHSQESATLT